MSKAPDASGEGVSRWKQRQAAKAMMYAMSNERSGDAIAARRQLATADKYAPQVQGWQGQAWGLASTKVSGRQDPKATRFSAGGSRGGELFYGQKREFNSICRRRTQIDSFELAGEEGEKGEGRRRVVKGCSGR